MLDSDCTHYARTRKSQMYCTLRPGTRRPPRHVSSAIVLGQPFGFPSPPCSPSSPSPPAPPMLPRGGDPPSNERAYLNRYLVPFVPIAATRPARTSICPDWLIPSACTLPPRDARSSSPIGQCVPAFVSVSSRPLSLWLNLDHRPYPPPFFQATLGKFRLDRPPLLPN